MEGFTSALVPLMAVLLVVTTGVHASCPLELSASRVVVKLGDSVSINCSTSEDKFDLMGWEATEGAIYSREENHINWTVKNLDRWDDSPQCFITSQNSTFKQCLVSPDIVLYTFPKSISINSNASGVMTLQEERTLTCEIERVEPVQNLSIMWFRNGQPFDDATLKSTDNKPRTVVSVIQLKASREENEVVYRCEAHLDLGPEGPYLHTSHEYNVTVHYPPSPITELEDSEVDVGHDVRLKCTSKGNPRPEYFWDYYNTTNVIENSEDGVSCLTISSATVDNIGSYTCGVRNDIGNVSKTVYLTVKGVEPECPIEILPNRMVVPYGSRGQQAQCSKTKDRPRDLVEDLYWLDQHDNKTIGSYWSVATYDNWNIKADCVAKFKGIPKCEKKLNITVYKTPDSVSINHLNYSSSVVEDKEFQLQCNITNVAPFSTLAVRWYQGNQTFEPRNKGTMQVTGCQNDADCDLSQVRTPVNVLVTISVTLKREHSGATFWCEAHLGLGPEGPQPSPTKMSGPLNLTVHYKPTINATKLPKMIPVFSGYPEELICEADGNPPPRILWLQNSNDDLRVDKPTLTVYKAGNYSCSATNIVASVSHEVTVILKEDYLPLIAGFVAVVVIIISVVFVFIYSIYYKKTKMRLYSLKNPKLSTHNGNVAHNGGECQFPMKRLS